MVLKLSLSLFGTFIEGERTLGVVVMKDQVDVFGGNLELVV